MMHWMSLEAFNSLHKLYIFCVLIIAESSMEIWSVKYKSHSVAMVADHDGSIVVDSLFIVAPIVYGGFVLCSCFVMQC